MILKVKQFKLTKRHTDCQILKDKITSFNDYLNLKSVNNQINL